MAIENRGPEVQAVCATFVSLAFVSTVLRIYTRTRIVKAWGYDDWWMLFALVCQIAFATCAIGGVHYGTGRHVWDLSEDQQFKAMRYWWLCYIAYCWCMIAAKLSIAIFLLRVTVKKMHKWIIYIVAFLTVLTGLVFFFVTLLQCNPVSYFWNQKQDGSCIPIDVIIALTFLYSAISVICDFTFALLPVFLIWDLNMSVRSRLMLIPILGMACIASVAVVVRMAFVMDFKDPDFLWATVDIAIWSDIEQGLAITAGSLATLRPLWRQITASFGFESSSGPSKPSGTPQWNGNPALESRKQSGFFRMAKSLLQKETPASSHNESDYGMGNLQPIRLRDDLVPGTSHEKKDAMFSTWRIHSSGKSSDEEARVGTITMETHIKQENERL